MKKSVKLGEVSKRASAILKRQTREFKQAFASAKGDSKKIAAAAKQYRKKYGATPAQRRKNALRLAAKHGSANQGKLF